MANAEAKGRRNAQEWGAVLERFETSGQSVETFCGAPSISAGSFYRWRSERQAIPPLASFVDLGRLADEGRGWELELRLSAAVVLRLRGG